MQRVWHGDQCEEDQDDAHRRGYKSAVLEQVSKYSNLGHMITEDEATLKEVQIRTEKTRQSFGRTKSCYEGTLVSGVLVLRIFSFQLWSRSMDLFQDGSKEDTDVRNVVLQETSQSPMDRKGKRQRNYTNGRSRRKTLQQLMMRKLGYAGPIMRGSSGPLPQLSL
ncbi:hypothetical protein ElyMa_005116300 [Elysia marginata]|uniref:Uncharacterized protein n=1 Tax=Elysia marginata TaxID=1093978 RepID=A0AAV4JJ90_9GAST|nr:hypothetical protein ElyMa_005116300 [Elysia marginata]